MKRAAWVPFLLMLTSSSFCAAEEPILGGPCENCELVFEGQPEQISDRARIAPVEEKGEPLILEGLVRKADGSPASGIVVYAYHTDDTGHYPRSTTRHGRLRGWTRTDRTGMYRFDTIRPRPYPNGIEPAHIHMHVIEPGKGTYWIDDVLFDDDELLTDAIRKRFLFRGGPGVTHPVKGDDGVWRVRRDITLGENVPGYE